MIFPACWHIKGSFVTLNKFQIQKKVKKQACTSFYVFHTVPEWVMVVQILVYWSHPLPQLQMPQQKIKCLASSNLLEQFWEKKTLRLVFTRLLELLKTIKWLLQWQQLLHNQSNNNNHWDRLAFYFNAGLLTIISKCFTECPNGVWNLAVLYRFSIVFNSDFIVVKPLKKIKIILIKL